MKHVVICALCVCVAAAAAAAAAANTSYKGDPTEWFNETFPRPPNFDDWSKDTPSIKRKFRRPKKNCYPAVIKTHGG